MAGPSIRHFRGLPIELINHIDLADMPSGTVSDHDSRYYTEAELGSIVAPSGASLIGVEDIGGFFAGADVEAVLQEIIGVILPADYLRLDGTNVPTANYNWVTNLTTAGTLQGGTITDGTVSFTGGVGTGLVSLTDGVASWAGNSLAGFVNITATGTIQGGTLTDGVASLTAGAWTGATYNGLTIVTGVNTFTLTRGTTDLVVNVDCTIDQDLSNTSSPTFNALTVTSINGMTGIGCAANVISITCGTTDLTVSADCAINQNLNTAASPAFAGLTSNGNISFDILTRTIAGIQNQNLVDKTAAETITGVWQHDEVGKFYGTTDAFGRLLILNKTDYDLSGANNLVAFGFTATATTYGAKGLSGFSGATIGNAAAGIETGSIYAFRATADSRGAGAITGTLGGAWYNVYTTDGSGQVSYLEGIRAECKNRASGTTTTRAMGIYISDIYASNGGVITTAYGIRVDNFHEYTGGSIGTIFGLYLDEQTVGGNNWQIYSVGGRNYFGGDVGIGIAAPSSRLHVSTSATEGHEAMIIDQNDTDQAFIDFQGTIGIGFTTNISCCRGTGAVVGPQAPAVGSGNKGWRFCGAGYMLEMEVNGCSFWVPAYLAVTLP